VEVAARRATADDLAVLETLAAEAIAELLPTRGGSLYSRREARQRPLADLLADPASIVLVGTIDATVVGYAAASVETLPDGSRLAVISDLFVDPGGREIGVGESLMDEVVAWARENGCFGVDAVALPGNRSTKNFFETFGLTARAIVVHRSLEGEP
jgi:GNAT superfamily N-acetyltransferase